MPAYDGAHDLFFRSPFPFMASGDRFQRTTAYWKNLQETTGSIVYDVNRTGILEVGFSPLVRTNLFGLGWAWAGQVYQTSQAREKTYVHAVASYWLYATDIRLEYL
jgi:hypothetical protein